MRIPPASSGLIFAEPPFFSLRDRAELLEVLYTRCDIAYVCVVSSAVLALYGQGLQTGVVVMSGELVSIFLRIFMMIIIRKLILLFIFQYVY